MTLSDALVHFVLIVGTVSRERRDGIGDLVEQRARPRGVIDLFPGQLNRENFTALGIEAISSLRQDRRRDVPCFSTSHSPAPPSFRPVLSTSKCSGPGPDRRSGGMSNALL